MEIIFVVKTQLFNLKNGLGGFGKVIIQRINFILFVYFVNVKTSRPINSACVRKWIWRIEKFEARKRYMGKLRLKDLRETKNGVVIFYIEVFSAWGLRGLSISNISFGWSTSCTQIFKFEKFIENEECSNWFWTAFFVCSSGQRTEIYRVWYWIN